MSKDVCRLTRKRFVKRFAGKYGVQVREVNDMVHRQLVDPTKREQERWKMEKHRKKTL